MTTPRYKVGDEIIATLDGRAHTRMVVTHVGEPELVGEIMRYTMVAETVPPSELKWSGEVREARP